MDKEVREKALQFAAKAVVSAAFLAACGGSEATTADDTLPSDDEVVATSPSCKAGLAALKQVFPAGDKNWYSHLISSDPAHVALKGEQSVVTCCESILKAGANESAIASPHLNKFRGVGCCAADYSTTPGAPGAAAVTACTPWGPPVPPAMTWKASATRVA